MDISIVIPAFNEAKKIEADVRAAAAFIRSQGFRGEILVVDDGSRDGTARAAEASAPRDGVRLHVLRHRRNLGKGAAVRTGVLASRGDVVLFADSGTCVPFHNALPAIRKIREGRLDVAIASRRLRESVIVRDRPWTRKLLSRLFHAVAVAVAGLPRGISDSQCGFKLFRGSAARELFRACRARGFMFDLEILLRARDRGLRIEEFPVEWTCDLDTRLRPGAAAPRVVREMLTVRRRLREDAGEPDAKADDTPDSGPEES